MITPEERREKAILLSKLVKNDTISIAEYITSMLDLEADYINQNYNCINNCEKVFVAVALKALIGNLENDISSDKHTSGIYEELKKHCIAVNIKRKIDEK